jgi:hypothetical protein
MSDKTLKLEYLSQGDAIKHLTQAIYDYETFHGYRPEEIDLSTAAHSTFMQACLNQCPPRLRAYPVEAEIEWEKTVFMGIPVTFHMRANA